MKLWQHNIQGSKRGHTLSLIVGNVNIWSTDRFKLESAKIKKKYCRELKVANPLVAIIWHHKLNEINKK